MSTPFHTKVSLAGFHFEQFMLTVNLASGITTDDVGAPMAVDTSAANKFKIAGDGDVIVGRLESVEDRTVEGILVGTVAFRFAAKFPVKAADTLAVGGTAVGAASGEVKAAASADYAQNIVTEVSGGYATVVKL